MEDSRSSPTMVDPRKTTLLNALKNILSPSEHTRKKAEELVKALQVIENFGMYLVDYIMDDEEKYEIRLLSVVLLKQYVETHWSRRSEKFRRPEISRVSKDYIKNVLPTTFTESTINLRTNVARVIASIAMFEYPDHWHDFLDRMIHLMKDPNPAKSHGAMQTLLEYVRCNTNISFAFLLDVLGHLLQVVVNSNQLFSVRTRCQAVKMFKLLVPEMKKMVTIKEGKCMGNNEHVERYVRSFSQAFLDVLMRENVPDSMQYIELKNNIIQTFDRVCVNFPNVANPYLQRLLPIIWESLVSISNHYKGQNTSAQDYIDEDGDVVNTDSQIIIIFDFVRTLCGLGGEISSNIYDVLPDLIFHMIVCMQITPVIMSDWNKNHENFINDDNNIEYKVRYAAYNLLNDIMAISNKRRTVSAFCQALCRHIGHAEQQRNSNVVDWWQGLEASMYALGCLRSYIIDEHNENSLTDFNLMGYLNTAAQYTQENDIPLLLGRCLWLCAMFCKIMTDDTLQIGVESSIRHLQSSESIFVRVYALRALKKYCEPELDPRNKLILEGHLRGILNCLCNIVILFGTNLLNLTLEAMTLFIKVNVSFTAASMELIVPFAISIFLKHNDDPIITSLMMDLIRALVQIPNVLPQLQQIFAPTLHSVLNTTLATAGVHIIALETLGIIVRNQQGPVSDEFLHLLFPAAVHLILNSTDFHVVQAGGECMTNFLFSGAASQVCGYRTSEGQLGIDFIIEIINKMLDPHGYEHSAKFISLLIIILIVKAGEHLFTRLEPLLRAILSKMQCTKSRANMQSLISIFGYLIYTQLDAVINFLSTIPGPRGESALEFVLMEWVFTHNACTTIFEYKVGIVGLIQLFEYGIANDHFVLRGMAFESENMEGFCVVPILSKILKVLLNTYDIPSHIPDRLEKEISTYPELQFDNSDDLEIQSKEEMDASIMALLPMLKHLEINDHIRSFFLTYETHDEFRSCIRDFNQYDCEIMSRMGIDTSTFMLE